MQLPALAEVCRREGVHLVRMIACEDSPVRDLSGARRFGHVRHVLSLEGQTADGLWAGYKKRVRRDVRVAEKAGIAVRAMRREEFGAFAEMLAQVQSRNAAATAVGPEFYEALWDELAGDGTAEFLVADRQGEPVAVTVGVHDRDTTYYFAACSRTEALRLCPNDLLVKALIEKAVARGSRRFDFLSSDVSDKGLIAFKEKWGSEERPFDLLELWFSSWRRAAWDFGMRVAHSRTGAAVIRRLRRAL